MKMLNLLTIAKNLLVTLFFLFLFSIFCFSQKKVDLELKVDKASETARGGEKFSYVVTVTNKGSAKATNVIFIQDEPKLATFSSYAPNKGTCQVHSDRSLIDRTLNCRLGDIEVGESIVTLVDLEFRDFGDVSGGDVSEKVRFPDLDLSPDLVKQLKADQNRLGNIDVSSEESEENTENNTAELSAQLLPSKNIPPRVEIISPKNEEVITRSTKKPSQVIFTIGRTGGNVR